MSITAALSLYSQPYQSERLELYHMSCLKYQQFFLLFLIVLCFNFKMMHCTVAFSTLDSLYTLYFYIFYYFHCFVLPSNVLEIPFLTVYDA